MDIIKLAEQELQAGWKWITSSAVVIYRAVEPMALAALKGFEVTVFHDLMGAAAALVGRLAAGMTSLSLPDLETAFLNTVQLLGPQLLVAAQSLGSTLLQSILGLLTAHAGNNPISLPAAA